MFREDYFSRNPTGIPVSRNVSAPDSVVNELGHRVGKKRIASSFSPSGKYAPPASWNQSFSERDKRIVVVVREIANEQWGWTLDALANMLAMVKTEENPLTLTLSPQGRGEGTTNWRLHLWTLKRDGSLYIYEFPSANMLSVRKPATVSRRRGNIMSSHSKTFMFLAGLIVLTGFIATLDNRLAGQGGAPKKKPTKAIPTDDLLDGQLCAAHRYD